ncbi:uncharacterized protein LOC143365633 isoform X2 [Halictus rubicundus]|uniref:uncharacterized protein LOC143365633 isoform X2 n=1 Tax=Halictus rubicundus TaxID=77578 RepID=UPI004035319C
MAGGTSWRISALAIFLFVTALSALPTSEPDAEVISDAEDTTLSTELKPPPPPEKEDEHQYVLFVINLYGLKNASGETSDEMFENEIIHKVPELIGPLATVIMVIEVDEEDSETDVPVDLDEVADDLENGEGFNVERINHSGETKVLRVKLDKDDAEGILLHAPKMDKMTKVRNRRSPCLKCKLKGYLGGGRSGGGGGGASYPSYHPSGGGGCSTCGGGGHGGYGGNSYSQASAQASAQSWGK